MGALRQPGFSAGLGPDNPKAAGSEHRHRPTSSPSHDPRHSKDPVVSATWRIFLLEHSTPFRHSFQQPPLSSAAVLLTGEPELIPKTNKARRQETAIAHHVLGGCVTPRCHLVPGGLPRADREPRRLQEECQPCDDAGDDENRFVRPSTTPAPALLPAALTGLLTWLDGRRSCRKDKRPGLRSRGAVRGHHHYRQTMRGRTGILRFSIGDSGQWRRRRCGYKKRPRATWIRYEVRNAETLKPGPTQPCADLNAQP